MTTILTDASRFDQGVVDDIIESLTTNGIYIDLFQAYKLNEEMKARTEEYYENIMKTLDSHGIFVKKFSPASPKQIQQIFGPEGLGVQHLAGRTKTGGLSYNADALEKIEAHGYSVAKWIRLYRSNESIRKKILEVVRHTEAFGESDVIDEELFLVKNSEDGVQFSVVHPQTAYTETSRLQFKEPGLSNLHEDCRSIVSAPEGYSLLCIDYSQQEPFLMSFMLNIEPLKQAFRSGNDFYATVAKILTGVDITPEQRKALKLVWLMNSYGASAMTIRDKVDAEYHEFADKIIESFKQLDEVVAFKKALKPVIYGERPITSFFGTTREIPVYEKNWAARERTAFNNIFQITGADILYFAFEAFENFRKNHGLTDADVRVYWSVHDEIIFLVRDSLLEDPTMNIVAEIQGVMALQIEDWPALKTEARVNKNYSKSA